MRLAYRALLGCIAALVLAMLMGTSALAQGVTIRDEATGDPCNPCTGHASGSGELFAHTAFGEVEVSGCNEEFEGELYDPDGVTDSEFGHIFSYANDHATNPECTRENCTTAGEDEWPMANAMETGTDHGTFTVDYCLSDENGNEEHCEILVDVAEIGAHEYQFSVNPANECVTRPGGAHVEVSGAWEMETSATDDPVEIAHL